MPAKGNVILLPDSEAAAAVGGMVPAPNSGTGANARKDVDHLVHEIKENLKLGNSGGSLKMRKALKHHRASPYAVPPSSRVACDTTNNNPGPNGEVKSQLKRWNHRRRYPSTCMAGNDHAMGEDPFQMLQELITDGSLIKEAVRRLQLGLTPKYNTAAAAAASRNETAASFYDSDDECRTPPAYPDLCCEVVGGGCA